MRSLFGYGSFGNGQFAPFRMGQVATVRAPEAAFSVVGEILDAVGVSESDVNSLLDNLPTELVPAYRKRMDECQRLGTTSAAGAQCLYKLFQDIKNLRGTETPPPPVPVQPVRPAESSFPVIPVVIGGLVAAGLVAYFATRG